MKLAKVARPPAHGIVHHQRGHRQRQVVPLDGGRARAPRRRTSRRTPSSDCARACSASGTRCHRTTAPGPTARASAPPPSERPRRPSGPRAAELARTSSLCRKVRLASSPSRRPAICSPRWMQCRCDHVSGPGSGTTYVHLAQCTESAGRSEDVCADCLRMTGRAARLPVSSGRVRSRRTTGRQRRSKRPGGTSTPVRRRCVGAARRGSRFLHPRARTCR